MYQIIFIKFLQNHQTDFNITLEIQKLSSIYKFNIKKIINNLNGALVEIHSNNLFFLHKNDNIIIIHEDEFYYNRNLIEYLQYKKNKNIN
jgi:hypothetical protein